MRHSVGWKREGDGAATDCVAAVVQGDNADFLYHLIDETGGFSIDDKEGWIRVRDPAKLDREKVDKLTMRVSRATCTRTCAIYSRGCQLM